MKEACAGCGCIIRGTVYTSSIYMSADVDICEKCSEEEEAAIEAAGTNDLPSLRKGAS